MTEIDEKKRLNEKKFPYWKELPNGGRRYWLEIMGKHGYKARDIKEVDNEEKTIKSWQEIYDDRGNLVEIHEKYPRDLGHKRIEKEQ